MPLNEPGRVDPEPGPQPLPIRAPRPVAIIALVDATMLALPPGIDTPAAADAWIDRVRPGAGTVLFCLAERAGATEDPESWRPTPVLAFCGGRAVTGRAGQGAGAPGRRRRERAPHTNPDGG